MHLKTTAATNSGTAPTTSGVGTTPTPTTPATFRTLDQGLVTGIPTSNGIATRIVGDDQAWTNLWTEHQAGQVGGAAPRPAVDFGSERERTALLIISLMVVMGYELIQIRTELTQVQNRLESRTTHTGSGGGDRRPAPPAATNRRRTSSAAA